MTSGVDPRLEELVDLIVVLAAGDLSARAQPSPARDSIDAVMTGINLLAAELQEMYGDLEARVAERTAELRAAQQELQRQATTDALTGLVNRVVLADRLDQAGRRARRGYLPPSVIMLDLDEFKFVNDTLGHAVGDEVLRAVGQRLLTVTRPTDTVARLGGDEFAVVLHDVTEGHALMIAQRITEVLAPPIAVAHRELYLRASVGIRFGTRGAAAEDLLRDADVAMYEAKAQSKGSLAIFEPAMHRESQHRLRILSELGRALADGGLNLHFQPIVRLADGEIVGAEALLRWHHPELGNISPALVVSIAEESGRIAQLGQWVMREAVRALRGWLARLPADIEFTLQVNVSPIELRRPDWLSGPTDLVARYQIEPHRLAFEISETQLMTGDVRGIDALHAARRRGFGVQIDDFGTGYSSIAYLRQLPLDAVKVDQSLTAGADGSTVDRDFVAAVLGLISSVGLRAIVEGIETPEQVAALLDMGAQYGQGYHFGVPVSEAELGEQLDAQQSSRI